MTIFFIILAVGLISGIILLIISEGEIYCSDKGEIGIIMSAICGLVLFGLLIALPLVRFVVEDRIEEFKSFQTTVIQQREQENDYEGAVLTSKIIDANCQLARWKNQNVWYRLDWYIPDKVEDLKPIK